MTTAAAPATDTITLTVKERLLLLPILPQQASLHTIRIVRQLSDALSFSEQELAEYELRFQDGTYQWRVDVPQERPLEIGPAAREIIVEALQKLDSEGKVTLDHLSLFEKFLPDGDGHG